MLCEMCNRKEACCKAIVEGAELSICRDCRGFGRVTKEIQVELPAKKSKQSSFTKSQLSAGKAKVIIEAIAADFSSKIRRAREKLSLTQQEFALKISEKESIVHKLETGVLEPDITLAKKLEKVLHITLIEEKEESEGSEVIGAGAASEKKNSSFTFGDFVRK